MYEVAMSSQVDKAHTTIGETIAVPYQMEQSIDFDEAYYEPSDKLSLMTNLMKLAIVCFMVMLGFGAYQVIYPSDNSANLTQVEPFDRGRLVSVVVPEKPSDFIASIDREFVNNGIDPITTASVSKADDHESAKRSLLEIIEAGSRTHTIQPGETLGAIAQKHRIKLKSLVALNKIEDPAKITAGTVLFLGVKK